MPASPSSLPDGCARPPRCSAPSLPATCPGWQGRREPPCSRRWRPASCWTPLAAWSLADRFLAWLPAALLGGLVPVELLATGEPRRHPVGAWAAVPTWPTIAGVLAATAVAVLTRRGPLAMAVGWVVMAAGMLVH